MSGKRLAGRYPFTRCLLLQWAHQRSHHACVMARQETLTPSSESALLSITVPSVVHKKRRTEVRLLLMLHRRCQPSLHNKNIVSEFTRERIKDNLV